MRAWRIPALISALWLLIWIAVTAYYAPFGGGNGAAVLGVVAASGLACVFGLSVTLGVVGGLRQTPMTPAFKELMKWTGGFYVLLVAAAFAVSIPAGEIVNVFITALSFGTPTYFSVVAIGATAFILTRIARGGFAAS